MSTTTLGLSTQQHGLDAARAVLRSQGRTFHFASQLLGRRHAERATVLYGFCRHVDNLADDADDPASARASLNAVRLSLRTGNADDPWTAGLLRLRGSMGMSLAPALALLDGVESDLLQVRIPDEAALLRYAYRVAGTVGLMMCMVLDVRDPRARPFAIDLGIAMQLTNISRDIGEDARLGRRYLPASWIGDMEPSDIAFPDSALQARLKGATQRLLALADRYYASGEAGLAFLPLRARLGILAAARMYRAIGAEVAAAGFQSWDRRAMVGALAKSRCTAQAILMFAASPRLHRCNASHDARLHDALGDWASHGD